MPETTRLRASVTSALAAHGIACGDGEGPAILRERLNEAYLTEVRLLKARQKSGEIARGDYASEVEALRDRFPLLGLPLAMWTE